MALGTWSIVQSGCEHLASVQGCLAPEIGLRSLSKAILSSLSSSFLTIYYFLRKLFILEQFRCAELL